MKHAEPLEIEIKLRVPALDPLPPRLRAAGFHLLHAAQPERSVLWDRAGTLQAEGSALRLRSYAGQASLTWKGPRQADPRLKIRPELETTLGDPEALALILVALGFQPTLEMVKERAIWVRGALEACLDQPPFGCFIELEGNREDIAQALHDLDLEDAEVEPRSYPTLYLEA